MNPTIRQIFLSAVTREFQRTREMLCSDLLGPDLPWKVAEQSYFAVSGMTLLEKLDRYVKESSAVVHLIGKMAGATGKAQEVEAFLAARPGFLQQYPEVRAALGDCKQLSYTQWEVYMALDHGITPFVFVAEEGFDERPPGFVEDPAEMESQENHLERLRCAGIDRGYFTTSERLCSQTLRSLSRMLQHSGTASDRISAEDLETFARMLDAEDSDQADVVRSVLVPLHAEIALPAHLLIKQSMATEFILKEPGRTPLERVRVDFSIGAAQTSAETELLPRGQIVRLTPSSPLIIEHEGSPPMELIVTCERACMREKFLWKGVANVITAEELVGRTGLISRSAPKPRRVRLDLVEEELRLRRGLLDIDLQPVPAAGARFMMGSPTSERGRQPDETLHAVRFARSWWMSRHPVSQAQYKEVMGSNPSKFNAQSDKLPVESVTWQEAAIFCERLTQMEEQQDRLPLGFQYRLPTEAEWEFSCRAGDENASASASGRGGTESEAKPLGTFLLDGNRGANRLGLCDMTGNVFQWCLDHYGPYLPDLQVDPCHTAADLPRVIRGGSWHDPVQLRRPAARMRCAPEARSSRIGFRVILARI
ncbi:MAG: formylglycine-generating enzyme family protein [Prosthecobacter sp.]